MPGADILAVAVAYDELGTVSAIRRTLGYYAGGDRMVVLLHPADCGRRAIGHFHLFHDSHAEGFWREALICCGTGKPPGRNASRCGRILRQVAKEPGAGYPAPLPVHRPDRENSPGPLEFL
ncbi:hypothetical protein [Paracoccus versutus]